MKRPSLKDALYFKMIDLCQEANLAQTTVEECFQAACQLAVTLGRMSRGLTERDNEHLAQLILSQCRLGNGSKRAETASEPC